MTHVSDATMSRVHSFLVSALKGNTPEKYLQAVEAFRLELLTRGLVMSEFSPDELDYALADRGTDLHEAATGTEGIGGASLLLAAMGPK